MLLASMGGAGPPGPVLGGAVRWMGWRLRLLVGGVLTGCLALITLAAWVGSQPQLATRWQHVASGQIQGPGPASERLVALESAGGEQLVPPVGVLLLETSSRWTPADGQRRVVQAWHQDLHEWLQRPGAQWRLDTGRTIPASPSSGLGLLPPTFWLIGLAALTLYVVGLVVVLAQPDRRTGLYALIAICQTGNLLAIAVEQALQWGYPPAWTSLESAVRSGFDLVTAAAMVQLACLYPRRLPGAAWLASLGWTTAVLMTGAALTAAASRQGTLPGGWWWVQAAVGLMGLGAIGLFTWSRHAEAHPLTTLLRRIGLLMLAGWLLLTILLGTGSATNDLQTASWLARTPIAWTVFLVGLLLIAPLLSRAPTVMREFALVAGVSAFAAVLDLMLVTLFAVSRFASLTVTLFLSLGLYAGARHWLLGRRLQQQPPSTGRMVELLLRAAREIEVHPERSPALMLALMKDLFEPIEATMMDGGPGSARIVDEGSTLQLPIPPTLAAPGDPAPVIVLRFAQHGRRLFTPADTRLADSVAEQLRRASAFGHAVEQGRSEERLRIAQDLHDDIGARLLTLMYQAPTPEIEDYVRHTLQDLKTLTRGLAASTHRLSHAAAEWKADLTHRLGAARMELDWDVIHDEDVSLSVVQWSALTRVLRELVSNAIAHAHARRLQIRIALSQGTLTLSIADDGDGRDPQAWPHGLGLGGVRKRVRQLGGEVEWEELQPSGICCKVRLPGFVL